MNKTKQRIAIAEACGWTGPFPTSKEWLEGYGREGEDVWALCGTDPEGDRAPLPDYLNDLNAMHEAEKRLTGDIFSKWAQHLVNIVIRDTAGPELDIADVSSPVEMCGHIARATAAQRAEAFLRTIGKWKNEKNIKK